MAFLLTGIGGLGKDGAMFGSDVLAPWVDEKLAPGATDQSSQLGFAQTARDVVSLKYFFKSPNLLWFLMSAASFAFFPYNIEAAGNGDATEWLRDRFALNFTIAFCYYFFFFYGLYIAGWGKRKYSPGSHPTMGNMVHNIYYWSLGVALWTLLEYVMCRIWASRKMTFATVDEIVADPRLIALNGLAVFAIPLWRDLHFYIAHRFIHVRAIYKFVHSLHHRNADPEPFSGMTMHPIEHLYYFSNAFIPSLYLPGLSPLIFLWCFMHLTIAPAAGHSGWEDNFQSDQYHWLHHKFFECNYGSPFSAFIDQFFGTFREKLGKSAVYKGEWKEERAKGKKKKTKAWGAKSYLGLPADVFHGTYTAFWVALGYLIYWGVAVNHGQTRVDLFRGFPIEKVIAGSAAYGPVIVAIILCALSGDRMSWRWPFHKERLFGTFGLFLVLGWIACVKPTYDAILLACERQQ